MDINTVALSGRLGSDLELRHTKTGTAVCGANLAVESGFGDKKKTNWIGLDFWGKSAESASKWLSKGSRVIVSGRLDQTEYEHDGKKVSKTRVVVENWTFGDSKGSEGQRPSPQRAAEPPTAQGNDDGDDIPF